MLRHRNGVASGKFCDSYSPLRADFQVDAVNACAELLDEADVFANGKYFRRDRRGHDEEQLSSRKRCGLIF